MRRLVIALVLLAGCAPSWKHTPHDVAYQRVKPPTLHRVPSSAAGSDWWDLARTSTVIPLARLLSPARYVGWVFNGRTALDVNEFGEVPDSAWFENRIGKRAVSPADVGRGPVRHAGPADGPLRVIGDKAEGVTPGLIVRDGAGVQWFVKFDPPAFPELTTGAEIVGSRLLYAAGYHVPETHIVSVALDRFKLDPKAKTRDHYNRVVPLRRKQLKVLFTQLNPGADGKTRALFSRAVPGKPIGPFSYRGFRTDDPNDRIPHERRRSLRGLWLFSAWINNPDTRRQNTLDTFIDVRGGVGFVRHYLVDFGDSLGATGSREKFVNEGHESRIDWIAIVGRMLSVGLHYPYWLKVRRSKFRSVGIFESEVFSPTRWAPAVPNDAFDEATVHDTFWAAAILARLDREHVAAAVATASYSERGAADYVTDVLMARREKLLRHAFAAMLGVNGFACRGNTLVFEDLEVNNRITVRTPTYRYRVRWNRTRGRDSGLDRGSTIEPSIDLSPAIERARASNSFADDPFLTLELSRDGKKAGIAVHLRITDRGPLVVGVERDARK